MATVSPFFLESFVLLSENITLAASIPNARGITRAGSYPATAGAFVAGVTLQDQSSGRRVAMATDGIVPAEVLPGVAIAIDAPLTCGVDGRFRPATGTEYVVGRAQDTATGVGAEFIRIKLGR